jgi:hypothetical protein
MSFLYSLLQQLCNNIQSLTRSRLWLSQNCCLFIYFVELRWCFNSSLNDFFGLFTSFQLFFSWSKHIHCNWHTEGQCSHCVPQMTRLSNFLRQNSQLVTPFITLCIAIEYFSLTRIIQTLDSTHDVSFNTQWTLNLVRISFIFLLWPRILSF